MSVFKSIQIERGDVASENLTYMEFETWHKTSVRDCKRYSVSHVGKFHSWRLGCSTQYSLAVWKWLCSMETRLDDILQHVLILLSRGTAKKSPWSMVYPQNVVFVGLHMDRKLSSTNLTSNHSSSLWTWKRAMRGPFSNWVLASMWLVVGISVSGDLKETVIPEPQFVTHWGSSKLGVIGSVVITFNQWQDDVWSHRCSRMLSKTFRTFSMCHWTTSSKFKI